MDDWWLRSTNISLLMVYEWVIGCLCFPFTAVRLSGLCHSVTVTRSWFTRFEPSVHHRDVLQCFAEAGVRWYHSVPTDDSKNTHRHWGHGRPAFGSATPKPLNAHTHTHTYRDAHRRKQVRTFPGVMGFWASWWGVCVFCFKTLLMFQSWAAHITDRSVRVNRPLLFTQRGRWGSINPWLLWDQISELNHQCDFGL